MTPRWSLTKIRQRVVALASGAIAAQKYALASPLRVADPSLRLRAQPRTAFVGRPFQVLPLAAQPRGRTVADMDTDSASPLQLVAGYLRGDEYEVADLMTEDDADLRRLLGCSLNWDNQNTGVERLVWQGSDFQELDDARLLLVQRWTVDVHDNWQAVA